MTALKISLSHNLKNKMVSHSFHEQNIDNPKLLFTSKQVKWGLRLDDAVGQQKLEI